MELRRRGGRVAAALAVALWSLFAIPPAGGQSSGAEACAAIRPADLRGICERGELRVARYRGERPPFFTRVDDRWVGFDVDLARDIAERLGVAYREDATARSFDEVIDRLVDGRADVGVSKLSATLARARRVRFSRPYLTVYQALLVNRLSVPGGGEPFEALNAASFSVGALAGSSYVDFAENTLARAALRPYDDFDLMMRDVVAGDLDAALMDSARANAWRRANQQRLISVRTSVDKSRRDPLAMAVAWDSTHLLAWLDLYLEQIRADGTAERLYRKWFLESGEEGR